MQAGDPPVTPVQGTMDNRHPLYPWIALCVPFTVLAIFVGILILKSDMGSRLQGLATEKLEVRQRYAIDHTLPTSIPLLQAAFLENDPDGWSESERRAVNDLLERSDSPSKPFEGEEYDLLRERFLVAYPVAEEPPR